MQTFATWLQDEHSIAPSDEMRVAMYAHAANGGIKIDKAAHTGVESLTRGLKHTMSTYCMINRTERGLSTALQEIESLETVATTLSMRNAHDSQVEAPTRWESQIQLAQDMVKAMRNRTESLGSHYRAD